MSIDVLPAVEFHLAAFAGLIYRYTALEDVTIEAYFVGTLAKARQCTLGMGRAMPIADLLCQAKSSLENAPGYSEALAGQNHVRFDWKAGESSETAASLHVRLNPDGSVQSELSNTSALSPHADPSTVCEYFRLMLRSMETAGDGIMSDIKLLSPLQRQTVLHMGQGAAMPHLLEPVLLHEIFEATVDKHPQNVAVICQGRQLTYAQLERRSNQLAQHLRETGVVPGSTVGLLLPRGLDVYAAMLAILKAGAAYVPLDCEYPTDRVNFILDDCKTSSVITTAALAVKHGLSGRNLVLLDRDGSAIDRQPTSRQPVWQTQVQTDDLCYVIYTSGSTGKPKGVQIEHRAASHLVLAERHIYGVESTDRVFQGFSVAFDASVEEIWMAFASGATLVAGTSEMIHAGPALAGMLSEAGVTVWSTVPTLLSVMTDDVPTLRLLVLGGESCHEDLVRRWYRPTRRMFNTYGPTEATVIATYTLCRPESPLTIGKAIPN